jgi:hypothetical protein
MPVGAMSNVRPWLRVERSGEITSVLVMFSNSSSWNHSAVFLADIQATPACAAQVTSRGWDAGWNSYATSSATWLENPDAMPEHCPR